MVKPQGITGRRFSEGSARVSYKFDKGLDAKPTGSERIIEGRRTGLICDIRVLQGILQGVVVWCEVGARGFWLGVLGSYFGYFRHAVPGYDAPSKDHHHELH